MTAQEMRRLYGVDYNLHSTFITFPNPDELLMFKATGYICLENQSNEPIELISNKTIDWGKARKKVGSFTLQVMSNVSWVLLI